ncbi:MAG: hypothetical protein ACI87E_004199, partial [Mariniblastus sp.]
SEIIPIVLAQLLGKRWLSLKRHPYPSPVMARCGGE